MTPERWRQIEDIFQEALDLAPAERPLFIDQKCTGDDELRKEVEKLVARFDAEDSFLESPVWTDSQFLPSNAKRKLAASLDDEIPLSDNQNSLIGQRVGVYQLIRELGKGGMGMVYLAERADGEFQRKVAVKLIKRGMDSDFIIQRFRHERQILAELNHPNIARLLGGGTTVDGSPYFVMEFIEGEQFFAYCNGQNLPFNKKIELFLQVCEAISYAHQRKIIHRDLKPSNILVTEEGIVKLLDFGIAKILDPDLIHEPICPTATQMRLMTPEYASPEQARGEIVAAASDQYSLGVLLYELITGARPYKFPSRAPHEIARVICEEIPSEPSSGEFGKMIKGDASLPDGAAFSRSIDRIVLQALRKNQAERYASVEDFAADIQKFLRREPDRAESGAIEPKKNQLSLKTANNLLEANDNARLASKAIAADNMAAMLGKTISPRWNGIKQGIFLLVLALVLIPVFLILIVTNFIPATLVITTFLLFLFGGIIRIIYAFFFESGRVRPSMPKAEKAAISETNSETGTSRAPSLTALENKKPITVEKIGGNDKTIAVLPFKILNTNLEAETGETAFLGIGLADALIARLSNLRQFIVRPTGSILRYGKSDLDSFKAGAELNVGFILDGTVIKSQKQLRVSVQLLDVVQGSAIFAERFDEGLTDVLNLEDKISRRVAESLIPKLSGEDRENLIKRHTDNADAYEAYMRGRAVWNTFTEDGLRSAIAYYQEAIKFDSNFAAAHAAIADYYVWLGMYSLLPVSEFYPPAINAARRAIELDPRSSEAYAALGLADLYGRYDWQESETHMRRAIELNPNNSVAHLWFTHNLYSQRSFIEGGKHLKRAIEIDPSAFQNHNTEAWGLYFERRLDDALAKADELIERFPVTSHPYFAKSAFLRFVGKTEESLQVSSRALEFSKDALFTFYGHAAALAAAGKRREALEIIETPPPSTYLSSYHTAIVYCFLKDKEKAFEALEEAFAVRESTLIWLAIEPSIDFLRDDARYEILLEKIKHPLAKPIST